MSFIKKQGNPVTIDTLESHGFHVEYVEKEKVSVLKNIGKFFACSVALAIVPVLVGVYVLAGILPVANAAKDYWNSLPDELGETSASSRITMLDKNGDTFAEIWEQDRIPLDSLDKVGEWTVKALVDTEDRRFYENKGFDAIATARSAITRSGGGSGITQQLVKNLQYYNVLQEDQEQQKAIEHTLTRKVQELKYALKWEQEHTKDETLLAYLNTVAFGKGSIYGIEAASHYFFGKSAKDLTLPESAVLVGTVNNPNKYSLEGEDWKHRYDIVLQSMLENNDITQAQYDEAKNTELTFQANSQGGNCASSPDPYYCQYVIDYIKHNSRYGATVEDRLNFINRGGLIIKTNYDPSIGSIVRESLSSGFTDTNRVVAPTVVVTPGDGGVVAAGVNRTYGSGEGQTTINPLTHPVAMGSAFKMFTLATALENGLTEKDLTFAGGCSFAPRGYDYPPGGFTNSSSCALQGGVLNYKQATAYSSNTWYTKLGTMVGVDKVKEMAGKMGLSQPESIGPASLSYILGAVEESPISTAAAFATFANGGVFCPATPIKEMTTLSGKPISPANGYDPADDSCRRVMSPKTASTVLRAMRANISGEVPGGFGMAYNIPGTAAKSGTNQLYNSAWAHISGNNVVYTNVYDFNTLTTGIANVWYHQRNYSWHENVAGKSGYSILRKIIDIKGAGVLDFDSKDGTGKSVSLSDEGFTYVPSVVGMTPEEAVKVLTDIGLTAELDKSTVEAPQGFPSGVIAEQSVKPGTRLTVTKGTEIILKESR